MGDMRRVNRRGWTLHEMVVSLGVMGGVIALAAHMATSQLRFFRGVGEIAALRGQLGQASAIAASVLWSASPAAGDIVVAQDSAIELHASIGAAVACAGAPGRVTIPAATSDRGNTLGAYLTAPNEGDRMVALFEDTTGAVWLTLRVAAAPVAEGVCAAFSSPAGAWILALEEPVTVPSGTPLRFTRPLRLSLYRASDSKWYLGARDWNGTSQRFNAIQPVAGPLRPYSANPAASGLVFVYRGGDGAELEAPVDARRVASVTIVSRGATGRTVRMPGVVSAPSGAYEDSVVVSVSPRNAR